MKQLRYLETIDLEKETLVKQNNGVKTATYQNVGEYLVQIQELTDEISASIYGADVNRMYRISSPNRNLEGFLFSKVNNTSDNVSLYVIVYNGARYRINVVRRNWIDIELLGAKKTASI